jgi:pilus assembly protein CpaB
MRPLFARPSMLGAILALLVGGGAYSYLGSTGDGGGGGGAKVAVVVAAADIPARTKIATTQLLVKEISADAVHPLAVRAVDQAVGRFTLSPLRVGEPLISADLSTAPSGSDLAGLVREGMRAVAIAVSDASGAGGFLTPGDRIDLVGIFGEQQLATIIASDLEVLAVSAALLGTPPPPDVEGAQQSPNAVNTTVTLSVTPEMATRVIVAEELGTLRVALRRAGDSEPAPAASTRLEQLVQPLSTGFAPSR